MPQPFGHLPDGRAVHRLVLGGEPGVELHLLTLGARVQRLVVTGGDGRRRDVALGHAELGAYLAGTDYRGATVGRYANRIAGGRVRIDGQDVQLTTNDRGNHLHGGADGFDRRLWEIVDAGPAHAHLRLQSPAGDQGYPGTVTAHARFAVTHDEVRLELTATTDAATLVNLTSHVYLNLDGSASIEDHLLEVPAARYTPVDDTGVPRGEQAPVDGTPFDLRAARRLGEVVRSAHPQVATTRGLDHDLVVDGSGMRPVAVLSSCATRTRMVLRSDQPGVQVYTGNALDHAGVALEPQLHPDSPHHADWPSALLRPGETYRNRLTWTFSPAPRPGGDG